MVKVWMGPTRQELAHITRAARKLGVSVAQFIRNELAADNQSQPGKIPPQSTKDSASGSLSSTSTTKLPRKQKG